MLPTREQWRFWSPIERIGYMSQLAAALALIPTVVFAWLGWREARMAREETTRMFLAEKAARIEVVAARFHNNMFIVDLKNTGESIATNVRVAITVMDESMKGTRIETHDDAWEDFHKKNGEPAKVGVAVRKGESVSLPVTGKYAFKIVTQWDPSSVSLRPNVDLESHPKPSNLAFIRVAFEDALSNEHIEIRQALVQP